MRSACATLCAFLMLVLAGCANDIQSVVRPQGPKAGIVNTQWWTMLGVAAFVYIVTMTLLMIGIFKRPKPFGRKASRAMLFSGGLIAPVAAFFLLLVYTGSISNAEAALPEKNSISIKLIGHQWWWEVMYKNSDASRTLRTANEIHIPVGQKVLLDLTSDDVIHSFWVPNLTGKTDLIPHLTNHTWLEADTPGVYRAQCAEFCGVQHAHMSLRVVAEAPHAYEAWYNASLQPAPQPTDPVLLRGQQAFVSLPCVICHTIRGTNAMGMVAPDLTHVGSRLTLAAGTLPNTPGYMGGWITDPQQIKPGNHMASLDIPAAEMQPLLKYLESLK